MSAKQRRDDPRAAGYTACVIRSEKDPMGVPGEAKVLAHARDLSRLGPAWRAMISPRVEALFRGFPDALGPLADDAPLPSMARWIRGLRDATCRLEIYRMERADWGTGIHLRFHFDEAWSPSFRGEAARLPRDIPPVLRRVQELVGGIDTQFMCSGTLVTGPDMKTVRQLVKQGRVLFAEMVAPIMKKHPRLATWRGVFEADGDWLVSDPEGRTAWLGGEWTGIPKTKDARLPVVLGRFFDVMTERKYFRPGL